MRYSYDDDTPPGYIYSFLMMVPKVVIKKMVYEEPNLFSTKRDNNFRQAVLVERTYYFPNQGDRYIYKSSCFHQAAIKKIFPHLFNIENKQTKSKNSDDLFWQKERIKGVLLFEFDYMGVVEGVINQIFSELFLEWGSLDLHLLSVALISDSLRSKVILHDLSRFYLMPNLVRSIIESADFCSSLMPRMPSLRYFLYLVILFLDDKIKKNLRNKYQLEQSSIQDVQIIHEQNLHIAELELQIAAKKSDVAQLKDKYVEIKAKQIELSAKKAILSEILSIYERNQLNDLQKIAKTHSLLLPFYTLEVKALPIVVQTNLIAFKSESKENNVPDAFIQIVQEALNTPKLENIVWMRLLLSSLKDIDTAARQVYREMKETTYYLYKGERGTAQQDLRDMQARFLQFSTILATPKSSEINTITSANICLMSLIRAMFNTPDLGRLHIYYCRSLQPFISKLIKNLIQRVMDLEDENKSLSKQNKQDKEKIQAQKNQIQENIVEKTQLEESLKPLEALKAELAVEQKKSANDLMFFRKISAVHHSLEKCDYPERPRQEVMAIHKILVEFKKTSKTSK